MRMRARRVNARGVAAGLLGLLLAGGCGDGRREGLEAVSEQGERLCRERMPDISGNSTAQQTRQAFLACLRTIEQELHAAAPGPEAGSPAPPPPPVATASAEERYLFCRFNSEAIAQVYDAHARASSHWAYADSAYPDNDPRYLAARQEHVAAVAAVERLIPPRLRGDQPLLPDALNQMRRCERTSFR